MRKRYVAVPAVVTINGVVHALREGDAYDADDPIVRERPDLFGTPVEEATAAPGAKRSTRR